MLPSAEVSRQSSIDTQCRIFKLTSGWWVRRFIDILKFYLEWGFWSCVRLRNPELIIILVKYLNWNCLALQATGLAPNSEFLFNTQASAQIILYSSFPQTLINHVLGSEDERKIYCFLPPRNSYWYEVSLQKSKLKCRVEMGRQSTEHVPPHPKLLLLTHQPDLRTPFLLETAWK